MHVYYELLKITFNYKANRHDNFCHARLHLIQNSIILVTQTLNTERPIYKFEDFIFHFI